MIEATIAADLRVDAVSLTAEHRSALATALAYRNPEHEQAERMGDARALRILPPFLSALRVDGAQLVMPRATGSILAGIVGREIVRFEDRRVLAPLPESLAPRGELRRYQARVVSGMLRGSGVATMPTGAGKTVTALHLIAAAGQCALVLVMSRDLGEQWVRAIREVLGFEAPLCAAGRVELAPIVVALVQTLAVPERLALVRDRFGTVVFDEAQHVPAGTALAVLGGLPARNRWAVSATPVRADGLDVLTRWHVGPVRGSVSIAELQAAGYLALPRYVQVATNYTTNLDASSEFTNVVTEAAGDPGRNAMIADRIAADCRGGVVGLALVARVSAVAELVELLSARGCRAIGISGASSPAVRRKALDATRAGAVDALVATTIADEGLDVPILQNLYLAANSKAEGRMLQRIGRVLRPHPAKGAPLIVDFVDARVGVLAYQGRMRRDIFARHFGAASVAA